MARIEAARKAEELKESFRSGHVKAEEARVAEAKRLEEESRIRSGTAAEAARKAEEA